MEPVYGCPMKGVRARHYQIVEAAQFAVQGTWPVDGGLLDQSASFVDAVRLIKPLLPSNA